MLYFIISLILSLALFIGLGIDTDEETFKFRGRQFLAILGLLPLLLGLFKFVPVNSVGIKFNQFNGVSEEVLAEGLKFKSPFDTIYIISTEVQTKTVTGLSGQTKDAQWIEISMDIKYRVSPTNAFQVFKQFKTITAVDEQLLSPLVQRSIEEVTTKYNVIDILGEKRNEVYIQIENAVKTRLAQSGIEFFSLVLTDTDAGAEIENAIVREAVAKKEVETALQTQEKARVEAQTKVIQASAAAEVKIIEATASAEVVLIAANAESEANLLLSKSLTENILRKMEMEARQKWGWVTISGANILVGQ